MRNPPPVPSDNTVVHVLAVQSSNEDRQALGSIFPSSNWRLWMAKNIRAAVAQLNRKTPFALVLCDGDIGASTWKELLSAIQELHDPPLMIVASHHADERLWAEALNLGAYDVLAKPLDAQETQRSFSSAWMRWANRSKRPAA